MNMNLQITKLANKGVEKLQALKLIAITMNSAPLESLINKAIIEAIEERNAAAFDKAVSYFKN